MALAGTLLKSRDHCMWGNLIGCRLELMGQLLSASLSVGSNPSGRLWRTSFQKSHVPTIAAPNKTNATTPIQTPAMPSSHVWTRMARAEVPIPSGLRYVRFVREQGDLRCSRPCQPRLTTSQYVGMRPDLGPVSS